MGSSSPPLPERLAGELVRLTAAHLERVRRIERDSFANPWAEEEFRRVLEDDSLLCLGLCWDGDLIGYAVGQVEGPEFHLVSLAIAPQRRRQGWGRFLLRQVLVRVRARGCGGCHLEVRASNQAALGLYCQEGFRQVARWSAYYVRPREDALVMQRGLEDIDGGRSCCSL